MHLFHSLSTAYHIHIAHTKGSSAKKLKAASRREVRCCRFTDASTADDATEPGAVAGTAVSTAVIENAPAAAPGTTPDVAVPAAPVVATASACRCFHRSLPLPHCPRRRCELYVHRETDTL